MKIEIKIYSDRGKLLDQMRIQAGKDWNMSLTGKNVRVLPNPSPPPSEPVR